MHARSPRAPGGVYILALLVSLLALGATGGGIALLADTSGGVIRMPDWPGAGIVNIYPQRHWAWTYSLFAGIMLILWIDVQIMFVGYIHPLQTISALAGVAIIVCALSPSKEERT